MKVKILSVGEAEKSFGDVCVPVRFEWDNKRSWVFIRRQDEDLVKKIKEYITKQENLDRERSALESVAAKLKELEGKEIEI